MTPTEKEKIINLDLQIRNLTYERDLLVGKRESERLKAMDYIQSLEWTKNFHAEIFALEFTEPHFAINIKPVDNDKVKEFQSSLSVLSLEIELEGTPNCGVCLFRAIHEIRATSNERLLDFLERTEFASIDSTKFHTRTNQFKIMQFHLDRTLEKINLVNC